MHISETQAPLSLDGHSGLIRQVLFLPDGRLASCAQDETIRVWDVETGRELFRLTGHSNGILTIALLANGRLASGSLDRSIKIWDLDERREMRTLLGHSGAVVSVCALRNGRLASCSWAGDIKVWDLGDDSGGQVATAHGHENPGWPLPMGVLADDSLVTCSRDLRDETEAVVRVWSPNDGRLVRALPTGLKAVQTLLVLADDRVALGFHSGQVVIVDPTTSTTMKHQQAHKNRVTSLAQLSNGDLISICASLARQEIKLWRLPEFGLLQTIHTGEAFAMVNFFDVAFPIHRYTQMSSSSVSPDQRYLASEGPENNIQVLALKH